MHQGTRLIDKPALLALDPEEITEAKALTARLLATCPVEEEERFLRSAALACHCLPERLRAFLLSMRAQETAAAFVVSGFPVDDALLGPTPHGWSGRYGELETARAEAAWLVLCGSVLGDLFGWATQQGGAIVHDIAPARADERSQVGSSSSELLWWHTEEAFHPLRCDYLGLMCLRNHDRVATTFASIEGIEMTPAMREVLFAKRFMIRPDDSHLEQFPDQDVPPGKEGKLLLAARERVRQMTIDPQLVALLSGDFDAPYLAIDPFYMDVPADDAEARAAFTELCDALEDRIKEFTLAAGEILFIDNYRAVHGRKPFHARYDGTDRWLKRINITRDLRKSRANRMTRGSRVIY